MVSRRVRTIMEVIRTIAAAAAATALLLHSSPTAAADSAVPAGTDTMSQSRLPGVWSFTDEQVILLATMQGNAWVEAKRLMRMEGLGIAPPKVGYGLLMGRYGSYDVGARTVMVDIRLLWQPLSTTVMVHEMIHFIQDKKDPLRKDMIDVHTVCREEKEAHDLTYKWAVEMNIAQWEPRVRKWEDAAISYGCSPEGTPVLFFP